MSMRHIQNWLCRMCGEHTNLEDVQYCVQCGEDFETSHDPHATTVDTEVQPEDLATAMQQMSVTELPIRPCQHFLDNAASRVGRVDCSICSTCDPIVCSGGLDQVNELLRGGARCWFCVILEGEQTNQRQTQPTQSVRDLSSPTPENGQFPFQRFHDAQIPKPKKPQAKLSVPAPTLQQMDQVAEHSASWAPPPDASPKQQGPMRRGTKARNAPASRAADRTAELLSTLSLGHDDPVLGSASQTRVHQPARSAQTTQQQSVGEFHLSKRGPQPTRAPGAAGTQVRGAVARFNPYMTQRPSRLS